MAARAPKSVPEKTLLLTIQQASAEFGPPVSALRELINRGHLPSVRLGDGTRIWIRRSDIEKLIERGICGGQLELTTRAS